MTTISWLRRLYAGIGAGSLVASLGIAPAAPAVAAQTNSCALPSALGQVQRVIVVQFDNTHFTRDDPNVLSDLEQMPHLLSFIEGNGVLLDNHHTPLIAHTATDILTTLTGVYPDKFGVPVANSYRFFNPDGSSTSAGSFAYWTDPVSTFAKNPSDTKPTMIDQAGTIAPAPWVPFTRAGCNVGSVATANTALENTRPDIATVFGPQSPEAAEDRVNHNQAYADFVGIAVHCAQGAALCSAANHGVTDALPDEPGGYAGFNGLFGHKYVAPQISPGGPLKDLQGNAITNFDCGCQGFPGFDGMTPSVTLAYVAAMQEHGVPITFAYVADAHENHDTGRPYGPGEAGYVAQLKAYDNAFAAFFARLASDGITKDNTLFVFTADEGDHFVGGHGAPPGCNGVGISCTYSQIGELSTNLTGLLATQPQPVVTTPFQLHADVSPAIYVDGNPSPTDPTTRTFERALASLLVTNPLTGRVEHLARELADLVEMKLLHMITADPQRTPTLTMFALPDYFVHTGPPTCTAQAPCVTEDPGFAWDHGTVSPDVNTTWLGLVGPGVRQLGVDGGVWSDHTDVRPTILELVGLKDDYADDGRVLVEVLQPSALSPNLRGQRDTYVALARAYKEIDATVGPLGLASLAVSTKALASGSARNDAIYTVLEAQLVDVTTRRDALAGQMSTLLNGAAFDGGTISLGQALALEGQAEALRIRVEALASAW